MADNDKKPGAGNNKPGAMQGKPTDQKPVAPAPNPVDPIAKDHWKKGNALFEEGKFEEALAEFTEAIKVDNKYADGYFNRALTFRIQNNFGAAKKDLDIVMELQPKSADAPLLIGDMAEANNDLLGARFWYEKALANNPDYVEAKNRLEHIDSLIHIDATYGKNN
jgi:tetratricopeptide (TPR) repeat protein